MRTAIKIILLAFLITTILVAIIIVKFKLENQNNAMPEKIIKKSNLAGTWFPAEATELKAMINNFLQKTKQIKTDNIRAIIVPHAGLIYSGQTAAAAYQAISQQNIKKVILLGPAHRQYTDKIALLHADYWETPLGQIALDQNVISQLETDPNFLFFDEAFTEENSLETQLPFLQTVLTDFKLIPLAVGVLNDQQISDIAQTLTTILDDQTLLIISTDLSHYHLKKEAQALDQYCLDSISQLEFNSQCEACGEMGLRILFQIAQSFHWQSQILTYSDSGDISGDDQVVGYVSALLTGELKKNVVAEYSPADQSYLLKLARDTINYALENNGKLMPVNEKDLEPQLKEKRGVFVTLHKQDQLRGCIGYIQALEKLYLAVQKNALAAAFEDPRFNPLAPAELADCNLEISILTLPQATSLAEIKPLVDGVIIQQGAYQATYLPQVWEDVQNPEEFYSSLCLKAGLDSNCYQDSDTKFFKYQAQVFTE